MNAETEVVSEHDWEEKCLGSYPKNKNGIPILSYAKRPGSGKKAVLKRSPQWVQKKFRYIPAGTLPPAWATRTNLYRLIERDGSLCAYCGSTLKATIEHVHPKSKGGDSELDNLVLACYRCNTAKKDMTLIEWLMAGCFNGNKTTTPKHRSLECP